jgi:sugar phosphate isomerase/epimerase
MTPATVEATQRLLAEGGYVADRQLGTTVHLALRMGRPIFLEGEPGTGKTEIAKVLAAQLPRRLVRLQCYDGMDLASAAYEWNHARQLMAIRLAEASGEATDRGALERGIYDRRFLQSRPLLDALEGEPAVLLIDELDRADEPFEAFLLEVKRRAYLRGVQIAGTAVGNNFALPKGEKLSEQIAYTKKWIDHSAVMGAPHIRVFAGAKPKDLTEEEAVAHCQEAYQECLDYAGKKGVFLGLENHGGIVALPDNLIKMVQAAKSPWAGINLDSGNFHTEDPYGDLAKIAPYAINVQLKMEMSPKGSKKGEGQPADVPRLLKILRDANYQGWFTLEYEVAADPLGEVPKILEMLRPLLG